MTAKIVVSTLVFFFSKLKSSTKAFLTRLLLLVVLIFSLCHSMYAQNINRDILSKVAQLTKVSCQIEDIPYRIGVNEDGSMTLTVSGKIEITGRVTQNSETKVINIENIGEFYQNYENLVACIERNLPTILSALDARLANSTADARRICRHPSHGIERYNIDRVEQKDSGWRSGGFSPSLWCNEVILALRGQYSSGEFAIVGTNEDKRSRCRPFNCPEYRYICTVNIKASPIYREKYSAQCDEKR